MWLCVYWLISLLHEILIQRQSSDIFDDSSLALGGYPGVLVRGQIPGQLE